MILSQSKITTSRNPNKLLSTRALHGMVRYHLANKCRQKPTLIRTITSANKPSQPLKMGRRTQRTNRSRILGQQRFALLLAARLMSEGLQPRPREMRQHVLPKAELRSHLPKRGKKSSRSLKGIEHQLDAEWKLMSYPFYAQEELEYIEYLGPSSKEEYDEIRQTTELIDHLMQCQKVSISFLNNPMTAGNIAA